MEVQLLRRPVASSCFSKTTQSMLKLRPPTAPSPPSLYARATRRHASSAKRTKRALNLPPHPSFLTSHDDKLGTRIIFNPPASEASVYHTPFKFLPKTDPRRRANLSSLFGKSTAVAASPGPASPTTALAEPAVTDAAVLPENLPLATKGVPKKYTVTEADLHEMRRLRALDPATYSVATLAQRFNCTKLFIQMCCSSSREHKEQMQKLKEEKESRWGPRKKAAVAARRRRTEMLYNGEL
ncbi:hypothetical protein P8C59_002967 [Phyllachora maydis]|uniref:Uncharacterized protein n=1 Tax=Phyllachora maydis TaxID=1825666 RepID=A0AAD9M8M8_9PEZI|nr:hypothetical protein P8C59_002967 [Phyllachora maydis]